MNQRNIELPARLVYLPFMKGWQFAMGLQPLKLQTWIEIDQDVPDQLRLKRSLLAGRPQEVFVSLPESQPAQQEVLALLLIHLGCYFPQYYRQNQHRMHNLITNERWNIADFMDKPLDLAGRLVQEDLCLLLPHATHYRLMTASVCFPSRWSLPEKPGQSLATIHHPVPSYAEQLQRPVDQMFDRLRPDYPYLYPLYSLAQEPTIAKRLAEAIQEIPAATQQYKNLLSFRSPVLKYLAKRAIVPS